MLRSAKTWLFHDHPVLAISVIYGSLNAIGDFCAQCMFSSSFGDYDLARTLRFLAFGFAIAPLVGKWNAYLERHFPLRPVANVPTPEPVPMSMVTVHSRTDSRAGDNKLHFRTSSTASAAGANPAMPALDPVNTFSTQEVPIDKAILLRRLAVDQVIMAPISFIIFLVAMGLMEMRSASQIIDKINANFMAILISNYKVWPLIQIVQFLYIPLKFRVPVAGVVGVMWTIYLSWTTSK